MSAAVEKSEAVSPGPNRATAYMKAQLARCLLRNERLDEAIRILQPAIEALDGFGAEAATYAANARLWLGRALIESGRLDRADQLTTAAVDHYRRCRDAEHPARAEAECELAQVLAARGQVDDALALTRACVPRIADYGQMEPWRKRSVQQLHDRLTRERVSARGRR